jgi:hypothetical protein
MNQLTIVHKKSNNQKVVSKTNPVEELENKRCGHGLNIANTKNVCRLQNTDKYYVQSESAENIYYLVSYKFDEQNDYCSCPDSSIRKLKCKHQFAIEHSIRLGKVQTIEKFNGKTFANKIPVVQQSKSWKDSEYSY